jgi:outer membrane biogenesis lipoprotein LolB
MTRLALAVALLLLSSCSHDAPHGQTPLTDMQLTEFKQQFNAAPGTRLLVLLSPT